MTEDTTAARDAIAAGLPQLTEVNAELEALISDLLSPEVAAALAAGPGALPPTIDSDHARAAAARASRLLRGIDSHIPALRVENS